MQFIDPHSITFKILSKDDTELIDEISHWQKMRYGYPIEADYIKKAIQFGLTMEHSTMICSFYEGNPVGFNMFHRLGDFLPVWHFGFYLAKPSEYGQGIMTNFQTEIFSYIIDYNCKLAESEGLYDWYIASIDSRNSKLNRQEKLGKRISERYNSYDIAKVLPGTKSKYKYINRLIGDKPFKRPLVVTKKSLKPEFRHI
jgi:hypothetical protein